MSVPVEVVCLLLSSKVGLAVAEAGLFVAEVPAHIRRLKGGCMQITIGGAIMLAAMLVVWVFAAFVGNDPGCLSVENSVSMSGLSKGITKFFLLCWLP